jgi:ABC-2 type transport system permease protein
VLPLFVWVAVDMVLWGFITRYLNAVSKAGLDFVTTLLGAVLLWDFFARIIHGVTTAFLEDVWSRNFFESVRDAVVGCRIRRGFGGIECRLEPHWPRGHDRSGDHIVRTVIPPVRNHCGPVSPGAVPVRDRLGHRGQRPGALAGACVRVADLADPGVDRAVRRRVLFRCPRFLAGCALISYALPPSPVFEGMRAIVAGEGVSVVALLRGGVLAVLYLVLACWLFTLIYRRAVRVGLIARYSAENIS